MLWLAMLPGGRMPCCSLRSECPWLQRHAALAVARFLALVAILCSLGCESLREGRQRAQLADFLGRPIPADAEPEMVCTDAQGAVGPERVYFAIRFRTAADADSYLVGAGFSRQAISLSSASRWREASPEEMSSRARCRWAPPDRPPVPAVYAGDKMAGIAGSTVVIVDETAWGRGWVAR